MTSAQILCTIAGGSRGIGYIYGGRVISGIGIGGISAVAPAYVSECSPKNVRGRITGLFQIMVAIGVMLSYFINCEPMSSIRPPKPVSSSMHSPQTRSVSTSLLAPRYGEFHLVSSLCQQVLWPSVC